MIKKIKEVVGCFENFIIVSKTNSILIIYSISCLVMTIFFHYLLLGVPKKFAFDYLTIGMYVITFLFFICSYIFILICFANYIYLTKKYIIKNHILFPVIIFININNIYSTDLGHIYSEIFSIIADTIIIKYNDKSKNKKIVIIGNSLENINYLDNVIRENRNVNEIEKKENIKIYYFDKTKFIINILYLIFLITFIYINILVIFK